MFWFCQTPHENEASMANDPEFFLFKEKSWEPVVEYDGNDLTYTVPVACGHFDKTFKIFARALQ